MKNQYLSKNRFIKEYYLDQGSKFGKNRVYLQEREVERVFEEIKKYLKPKRKTLLYLDETVPKSLEKKLKDFAKETKIKLGKFDNGS